MSGADDATGSVDSPVALVDLGDTLAECTPALRRALARLREPGEHEGDEALIPLPPHWDARRREVLSTPGFWRDLEPRAAGFELLGVLRDTGFRVYVLTKGSQDAPQVWADKVFWCRAHLPGVPVIVTDDKSRVHGHVLVDDWLPYVEGWQRQWPAGVAIVPAQPWNAHIPMGPRRFLYEGNDCDRIRKILRERLTSGTARTSPG